MLPYLIEDVLQLILRQCRALDVFNGSQVFGHSFSVFLANWLHPLFSQLLSDLRIITQIRLRADNEARYPGAMMVHLGEPFLPHVLERGWGCHAEAHEEHVRLGVRQRTEAVIVFLTRCIKQAESVRFVADPK